MPSIISRAIIGKFSRGQSGWDTPGMNENLQTIDDHLWIPANRVVASTTLLPASSSTGYTVLVQDTGEMHVWSCGEWKTYPARMGKLATDGTDIWMNSGTRWTSIGAQIQELINAADLCTVPGFTTSVRGVIENTLGYTDCDGNDHAPGASLPTCDQMMSAIGNAITGPVQSVQSGGGLVVNSGQLAIDADALCTALQNAGCFVGGGTGGAVSSVDTSTGLSFNSDSGTLGLNPTVLCQALSDAGCSLGGTGGTGGIQTITGAPNSGVVVTPVGAGVQIGINCIQLGEQCGFSTGSSQVYAFATSCYNPGSLNAYAPRITGPAGLAVSINGTNHTFDANGVLQPEFTGTEVATYPVTNPTNPTQVYGYVYAGPCPGTNDPGGGGF